MVLSKKLDALCVCVLLPSRSESAKLVCQPLSSFCPACVTLDSRNHWCQAAGEEQGGGRLLGCWRDLSYKDRSAGWELSYKDRSA